ncbi:Imm1 family immunity protein [Streptomyces sp. KLOTTS4A1]|uniref:Imm1 family immunity protein n=1 Tax=Streptomyces sp. KLOTTS4A1 TaxID=3390996 RepID=UPI0039F601E7
MESGFPDHELLVGVDSVRQVGVLGFMDERGNFVSHNPSGNAGDVTYFAVGNPTDFPGRSEISIRLVRDAVKEFLSSGGARPTCVRWKEPEVW